MRSVQRTCVVILGVALSVYAVNCAALTPQQAMECCKSMSMRCASHGQHGMDCCKTMQGVHSVIGQPSAVADAAPSLAVIGASFTTFDSTGILEGRTEISAANCHAPPGPGSSILISLRI
jgi:hypothetical protein